MNRLIRFILGPKQVLVPIEVKGSKGQGNKMSIEETIRRYEQLSAR